MTTGEIEDILSSIRRLVSEDLRPAPRGGGAALVSDGSAAGRLVLTPALRVVPPGDEATLPPAPLVLTPADAVDPPPQAEEPAVPEGAAAEDAPDGSADTGDEAAGPTAAAEPGPAAPPSMDDRIARIAAAAREVPADRNRDAPAARLSWIDVAAAADEDAGPAPTFVHRPAEPADQPALIGTTDDVLDETVLREIVRSVLREELQGHLGERITRNIRKLVRAEVHRAITLRDYD